MPVLQAEMVSHEDTADTNGGVQEIRIPAETRTPIACMIQWAYGSTTGGGQVGDASMGIGCAGSSFDGGTFVDQFCVSGIRNDGASTPSTRKIHHTGRVIYMMDVSGSTSLGDATSSGFVAGGMDLTWQTAPALASQMVFSFLFEDTIAAAAVGTIDMAGNASLFVGTGFKPNMILAFHAGISNVNDLDSEQSNLQMGFGACGIDIVDTLTQHCACERENGSNFDTITSSVVETTMIAARSANIGEGGGQAAQPGVSVASVAGNGFTLNRRGGGMLVGMFAFRLKELGEGFTFPILSSDGTGSGGDIDVRENNVVPFKAAYGGTGMGYVRVLDVAESGSAGAGGAGSQCFSAGEIPETIDIGATSSSFAVGFHASQYDPESAAPGGITNNGNTYSKIHHMRLIQQENDAGSGLAVLGWLDNAQAASLDTYWDRGHFDEHRGFVWMVNRPPPVSMVTLEANPMVGVGLLTAGDLLGFEIDQTALIDLWNQVSQKLGGPKITAVDQQGDIAELIQCNWKRLRTTFLNMHTWNGAKTTWIITDDEDVTDLLQQGIPNRWTRAYRLPMDYLRIYRVDGRRAGPNDFSLWEIEVARTDRGRERLFFSGGTVLEIEYIFDVGDRIDHLAELTVAGLSSYMAWQLAIPFGRSDLMAILEREYKDTLTEARSVDGQEGIPQQRTSDNLVQVRHGRFGSRRGRRPFRGGF